MEASESESDHETEDVEEKSPNGSAPTRDAAWKHGFASKLVYVVVSVGIVLALALLSRSCTGFVLPSTEGNKTGDCIRRARQAEVGPGSLPLCSSLLGYPLLMRIARTFLAVDCIASAWFDAAGGLSNVTTDDNAGAPKASSPFSLTHSVVFLCCSFVDGFRFLYREFVSKAAESLFGCVFADWLDEVLLLGILVYGVHAFNVYLVSARAMKQVDVAPPLSSETQKPQTGCQDSSVTIDGSSKDGHTRLLEEEKSSASDGSSWGSLSATLRQDLGFAKQVELSGPNLVDVEDHFCVPRSPQVDDCCDASSTFPGELFAIPCTPDQCALQREAAARKRRVKFEKRKEKLIQTVLGHLGANHCSVAFGSFEKTVSELGS